MFVQSLLCALDILAISEHWLHAPELSQLSRLGPEFCYYAKSHSPIEGTPSNYCSRGKGGVALVWRKSLGSLVSRLDVDSDRIIGMQFHTARCPLCFFAIYLPTKSGCTEEFRDCLDLLDSLVSCYSSSCDVIILGDFNADMGNCGPWSSTSANVLT